MEPLKEIRKRYNTKNIVFISICRNINREGVIVNYDSMMRPSYPSTAECIDKWLEQKVVN